MPAISLTARQRRALRALDWIHDTLDETRQTGRSFVLALSYLRRLTLMPAITRDGWIDVSDHVSNRDTDRMMLDTILRLASRLGFEEAIEIDRPRTRIRLISGGLIPDSFRTAITEFGDLHDDELGIVDGQLRVPQRKDPKGPPMTTFWEHLTEP